MPVSLLYFAATLSFAPPTSAPEVLPLRRLRLYETGVGYFERRGGVKPKAALTLPLPASHLDDALKTLVVLDASGDTHVQGLQFASAVSESGARALAGLPQYTEDAIGYVDVLTSLEGSRIEVSHAKKLLTGVLVEVEGPFQPPPPADGKAPTNAESWHAVVVVDDRGGIHRVRTDAIASVRAVDEATQDRLKVAAEALSDQSARRPHPLEVRVSSSGQLGLGYIAESPVWRTTYRVVLPDAGVNAELQAWALVHNDTDEDWSGVQLELANGQPQSFLYPLAAPRYAYRELTGPDEDLSTVPQLATETADRMWGDGGEAYGLTGLGRGGGGSGEGTIGLGSVGLIGRGGGSGTGSGGPQIGDLASLSQAEGEESGSLFIYQVADPLDLDAHHSALVPVVAQTVEAESITWFSNSGANALTGARVVNTTNKTLPAGVVSFFADGGFVGETALHRLKPKERQFVAFGTEQDITLNDMTHLDDKVVRDVSYADGTLTMHIVDKATRTVELHNRSGRSRQVYVDLDLPRNARVEGDAEMDFDDDSNSALVIVPVPAGKTVTKTLQVQTGRTQPVPGHDDEWLAGLENETSIPASKRKRIGAARRHYAAQRKALGMTETLRRRLDRERDELARLRSDLDALGRARLRGRVAKKLAKQLLETEHRVEELRDELKETQQRAKQERLAARRELNKI